MENLFSLEKIVASVNDTAAGMVEAYQKLNKSGATAAQNKKFAYSVMAFDIALDTHGVDSFTAYDASTRAAILGLHEATVATAYQAISENLAAN